MQVAALPWSVVGERRRFRFADWLDTAVDMGLDGIEFMDNWFPDRDATNAARDAVLERGLTTACVTVHAPVCLPKTETVGAQERRIAAYMGLARELDCPTVRVIGTTGSWAPAENPVAAREFFVSVMERLLPRAEDLGLRFAVENHFGGIFTVSRDLVWLFERCSHPRLGVNFDFKNSLEGGEAPEDFIACAAVRERLFYCHLDNFATTADGRNRSIPVNRGELAVEALLRSVKETGYDGWLSIEYGGYEQTFAHVAASAAWLRQTWPRL
jgi:sugar phosphate isomerase/epimerase